MREFERRVGDPNLAGTTGVERCLRRNDLIGYGPRVLVTDPQVGVGLRPLALQPLPPTMPLGLLTLRGVPLGSASQRPRHVASCSRARRVASSGGTASGCIKAWMAPQRECAQTMGFDQDHNPGMHQGFSMWMPDHAG